MPLEQQQLDGFADSQLAVVGSTGLLITGKSEEISERLRRLQSRGSFATPTAYWACFNSVGQSQLAPHALME